MQVSSKIGQSYHGYFTGRLKILLVFINLSLITSSLINLLAQTSSHSPKNYGRHMQIGLMLVPHQTKKWVPLVLFLFKTQQQGTAQQKTEILNHHLIGRAKTYDYNVTRKEKDKKNGFGLYLVSLQDFQYLPATNYEVLVSTGTGMWDSLKRLKHARNLFRCSKSL